VIHTGANVHDSQQAIALVDAIPAIRQFNGGRRRRPNKLNADRAYDAEAKSRKLLRARKTILMIAKQYAPHDSALGKYRFIIESYLHGSSNNGYSGFGMRSATTSIMLSSISDSS
jgi:hypothetical protein